jgi:hypothetical protein
MYTDFRQSQWSYESDASFEYLNLKKSFFLQKNCALKEWRSLEKSKFFFEILKKKSKKKRRKESWRATTSGN